MAIVKCPNCGKQISDRSENCPFCNTVLIKPEKQEKLSAETVKTTTKENMIGCMSAAIISFVIYIVIGEIFSYMASSVGENAKQAIRYVTSSRLSYIIMILIIEMLFFCLLPLLFKRKPDIGYVAGIILSVIFIIICYCVQNIADRQFPVGREDLAADTVSYLRVNGLSIPLLQGALSLLSYRRNLKKIMVSVPIMAAVYFVLSIVLGFLAMTVLEMEIAGVGLAQLIAGILVFIVAVIKCEEMRKLFHR